MVAARSWFVGLILAGLPGCCVTLPSSEGPLEGPRKPGEKLKVRERRPLVILPGTSSEPPPPEAVVTSSNCGDVSSGGPVSGGDCVTQRISCGETVIGHTRGGVNRFRTRWYEQNFCWPGTVDHDGGDERVYRLDMPEGEWRAFVYLDSPCADLDLLAMRWNESTCPSPGTSVTHCEANLVTGAGREKVELVHQGKATWLLVVEGADDEEGLFAVSVVCREGLH
jgi:hypothetical protein